MDAQPVENPKVDEKIDAIYDDYLEEVKRVKKEWTRTFNLYRLGGLLGILIMIVTLFGKLPPSAFWAGAFLVLIMIVLGLFLASARAKKEAEKTAQTKPGFAEFYKLFQRRYWPYQIVAGEKYDKFLSIIGRKASQ